MIRTVSSAAATAAFLVTACRTHSWRAWLALPLSLLSLSAFSHPGHATRDHAADFFAGLMHPLTGLDHLMALLAVGLWAALAAGTARWLLPITFTMAMLLGTLLAGPHGASYAEVGAWISVPVLAAAVIARWRPLPVIGAVLVSCFALCHGWSHTAAAPVDTAYLSGLLLASVLLQGVGLWLGALLQLRHVSSR